MSTFKATIGIICDMNVLSVQYSASERRRLVDFWPSNLIYDSDGGIKIWHFCIRVEIPNFDQKSYP